MERLRLFLLGGFRVQLSSGQPLNLTRKKAQALLAYLSLRPGEAILREKLITLLWGDTTEEQARHNLRQTLFLLRKTLPDTLPPPLLIDADTAALHPHAVDADVVTFVRLVGEGTPESLVEALAIYQGDFLEGFGLDEAPIEEWLRAERERLHELAFEACAKLLAHQMKEAEVELAIRTALRLLALDPLQEVTHRVLMRLYMRQGRRGDALRQYQICVDLLQRELGVEPEEATRHLYQTILPERHLELARLEPVALTPIRTKRRDGFRSRRRPPPLETPLIGRDAELRQLRQILREVWRRQGTVLALLGEAGVGKTRMVEELSALAARRGATVMVGRAYETAQVLPFSPWVDALRCDPRTVQCMADFNPVWRAELARLLPELGTSAPMAATNDALPLFEAITQLMMHVATRQPLVLVLEDLHWADEMTLRLLAFLGRRIQSVPVLTVTTAREEELSEVPLLSRSYEELRGHARLVRLPLSPLSRRDTANLVSSLAGTSGQGVSQERLYDHVWRVSEGNPFLVVETLRGLQEDAVPPEPLALPLPKRVRELVAARLARLSERSRHVVSVMSVIGRECDFDLLRRAAGLDDREAAETVEELVRRRVVHGVGERLDFTHDRIREVALGQLVPSLRRALHRLVAVTIEDTYTHDRDPHSAALAMHYREGEVWDKAFDYFRRAGALAIRRSAFRQAAAFLEQALDVLGHVPESRATVEQAIDVRLELRTALHPLEDGTHALSHLLVAKDLAEHLGDRPRQGRILTYLAREMSDRGNNTGAVEAAEAAATEARRLGNCALEVVANLYLAEAHERLGHYRSAIDVTMRNLRVLEDKPRHESFGMTGPAAVFSRTRLVLELTALGDFAQASAVAEEELQIAEAVDQPFGFTSACYALGVACLRRGDFERSAAILERGLAIGRARDVRMHVRSIGTALGVAYAYLGRLTEAQALFEEMKNNGFGIGPRQAYDTFRIRDLGEIAMVAGRWDDAEALGREALQLSRDSGQRAFEARSLHLLGEIALRREPPRLAEADASYREALSLADALEMRPVLAQCRYGLAIVARHQSRWPDAHGELSAAIELFRAMGMMFWLSLAEQERDLLVSGA